MQINTKPFLNRILSLAKRKKISSGPVITALLEWLLTDGSGTNITAIQGPNGTTNATWSTNLPGGFANPPYYSLQYDGTTSTSITNSPVNYGANVIVTVDAWVYSTTWSSVAGSIMDNGNANNGGVGCFTVKLDGFGGVFTILNDGVGNQNQWGFPAPTTSGWHQIKVCFNQNTGNISCSLDGVNQTSIIKYLTSWTTPTIISNNVTTVGNTQTGGGPNNLLTGNLAQVYVWPGDTH